MSNRGESLRVLGARFVRDLPGPTERVWEYLTDCRKLTAWFGDDGKIEPREGATIRFMQGHIRGVVTQWKPPRRLAYTHDGLAHIPRHPRRGCTRRAGRGAQHLHETQRGAVRSGPEQSAALRTQCQPLTMNNTPRMANSAAAPR
jgi:uncharacterized protein YndB with AHSA1/START domain